MNKKEIKKEGNNEIPFLLFVYPISNLDSV
jgi:hypothetical protein